jgi:hypothetical protein
VTVSPSTASDCAPCFIGFRAIISYNVYCVQTIKRVCTSTYIRQPAVLCYSLLHPPIHPLHISHPIHVMHHIAGRSHMRVVLPAPLMPTATPPNIRAFGISLREISWKAIQSTCLHLTEAGITPTIQLPLIMAHRAGAPRHVGIPATPLGAAGSCVNTGLTR